jgi:hypothetical protein
MKSPNRRQLLCACAAGLSVLGCCGGGVAQTSKPFCQYSLQGGWSDDGPEEYVTRTAQQNDRSGVPQVVRRIRDRLSITPSFEILIAQNEHNAFATVAGGRKILVVDVDFLESVNRIAGTEWAAIQIISHEVGHHISGFLSDRHKSELNADYWSGQTLQRLGAAESASTAAILTVGSEVDTPTHPNKYKRADVIRRGWIDANRNYIDYSFCEDCG